MATNIGVFLHSKQQTKKRRYKSIETDSLQFHLYYLFQIGILNKKYETIEIFQLQKRRFLFLITNELNILKKFFVTNYIILEQQNKYCSLSSHR